MAEVGDGYASLWLQVLTLRCSVTTAGNSPKALSSMVINGILGSLEMYGISQNQVLIDFVQLPHNNSMQPTALRAAADDER